MVQNELENLHCNWSRFYSLKPPQLCTKRAHTAMVVHGCYCVHETHTLALDLGFPVYASPEAPCYLLISALYRH